MPDVVSLIIFPKLNHAIIYSLQSLTLELSTSFLQSVSEAKKHWLRPCSVPYINASLREPLLIEIQQLPSIPHD